MNKNIISKTLNFFTCWLLIFTIIATSCITVFATEDDLTASTEEFEANVYDAESLKTYLQVKNANIVLWQDITINESIEAICSSIDLNGYSLTFLDLTLGSDGENFSILDSAYNSESKSSSGKLLIQESLDIGNATYIIQNGIVTVSNGIKGTGDIKIYDGVVTVSGRDGVDGENGSNVETTPGSSGCAGYNGGSGTNGTAGEHAIRVSNIYIHGGYILVTGGNGGNGGNGGSGGRASDSESSYKSYIDGQKGGNGGSGGNAGKSGAGIIATGEVVIRGGCVIVVGGSGGDGGNGGNGGGGGRGSDYDEGNTGHLCGRDGGPGGSGGNGGANSRGGEAILASKFVVYSGQVTATGGKGGAQSLGGDGGNGGYGGRGYGNYYPRGEDGARGTDGENGAFFGNGGAGINADFTMYGGQVIATGGNGAAGIGGSGYGEELGGHAVSILGGSLTVTGGTGSFDIGGGYDGTKVGAGGSLTVTGGIVEFGGTTGRATNVSNPTYENCTITGAAAYQHEGTYDGNGKFMISVENITVSPESCVGYDKVALQAALSISRSSNISTPSPKGYISFKLDGIEIGTSAIADPILEGDHIEASASIDWIAVENNHLITAEYIAGTNDKYASAGVFEFNSNIAVHTHNWEDDFTVDLNPTCVTVGQKSIHCSICNAQKDITEIPTSNHNYVNNKCQYCEGQQPLVVFKNYDGSVLSSAYYCIGEVISVPNDPTRDEDNTYTYNFVGWDKEIVNCDGSKEYTAIYESIYKNYTVAFKNYNGDVISTKTYHYGDAVVVPGTPKKPSDANYCYVFVGWDKSVTNCYGDAVYTAKFTASDLPIATVNNSSARANETVVVNILLSGAPNLGSLAISDISYNTSAFELVSFDWKVADAILSNWDAATGKGALALSTSKDLNGTIISLTFKVKDGTADGNYPVSCTVTSQESDFKNVAGQITVYSVAPGDVDGNESLDKDDAIYLLMHSFFPEDYPINQEADYNGNGTVDKDDAIHLLMHTFFPDDYPLAPTPAAVTITTTEERQKDEDEE